MKIELTSCGGTLKISPAIPELEDEMTFTHKYMPTVKKQIVDRATGQLKEISLRGDRMKFDREKLFTLQDGAYYTHVGLYSRVIQKIQSIGLEYSYQRLGKPFAVAVPTAEAVEGLYPEQVEGVVQCLASYGGALVQAPTGFGKTRMISALIRCFPNSRIVVTTYLASIVKGLHSTLRQLLGPKGIDVGMAGEHHKTNKRVSICSVGKLKNIDDDQIDVLIYDEADEAASDSRAAAILKFASAIKFGFSATLKNRMDGKEKFLESIFGPIVYEISDEQAENLGAVCPTRVYCISVPEGPDIEVVKNLVRRERIGIMLNPVRNLLIKRVADRVPVDQQVIIFCRTVEHINELKANFIPDFEVYTAELPATEKDRILKGFLDGSIRRIISTDCLARGVDPKNLFVLIDADWTTSEQKIIQKGGRNRRHADGKEFGVLVTFEDEWCEVTKRRAESKFRKFAERGYELFRNCSVEQIEFCK
jgi:superfamily II DNA or RNA helicase